MQFSSNSIPRLRGAAACALAGVLIALIGSAAATETVMRAPAAPPTPDPCPRPREGSGVPEPRELRSVNGRLELDMSIENSRESDGSTRVCYRLSDGSLSPTLRVHPGDWLVLRLSNRMTDLGGRLATAAAMAHGAARVSELGGRHAPAPAMAHGAARVDPCRSGAMSLISTNLHFHGLTIPSVCHQDEVIKTSIPPGSAPFEYRLRIPPDEPAGLYWYHPHIHGFTAQQVSGGASGALIVEGLESSIPEVGGLPERVLVIRDQDLMHPDAAPAALDAATMPFIDHDGDAANTGTGFGRPARDLSVNFVPVPYPEYPTASIAMKPGERQLWRILNASSVTYLSLSMVWTRGHWRREQFMGLVAVDGVPLNANGSPSTSFQWRDRVLVPPGARVELIVNAPLEGTSAQLVTRYVDTGPAGENDPNRPLVSIATEPGAPEPASTLPASTLPASALPASTLPPSTLPASTLPASTLHASTLPASTLPASTAASNAPDSSAAASAPTLSPPTPPPPRPWVGSVVPSRTRKLIFSEEPVDPGNPNGAMRFYLTVDGQTPKAFDPTSAKPNLVAHQGDVEDWIIENRSSELHAFHIHQVHFEIVEWLGVAVNEPFLRDTINVPYWTAGMAHYPSIKLRMDFRDPDAVGTFPYHCHLLDHEDAGMMGTIRVEPKSAQIR